MRYRTWDRFSEQGNVLHTLISWMGYLGMGLCLAIQMHISMDALRQNPTSSVLNVKGWGGGAHLPVSRWLKLICINSFTNQNQQFMCFGRWKQQKSVFRSRARWTLSHLAQTCLQSAANPSYPVFINLVYTVPVQLITQWCLGSRFQTAPIPPWGNPSNNILKQDFYLIGSFFALNL